MFDAIADFISKQQGDSLEFLEKARAVAIGVARTYEPKRLYLIRIDNWFGPRWMKFAGKYTAGKHFAIGVHKRRLHVPPFVPHRVVMERVLVGPEYEKTTVKPPLHIACPSEQALGRRIEDVDGNAVFMWFNGESEEQGRGAVMFYLPFAFDPTAQRRGLRDCGAFYVGFSRRKTGWEPAMLRGVSLGEVVHLEESGRILTPAIP